MNGLTIQNFVFPQVEMYLNEIYAGSETKRLLVVITNSGSFPSCAIFDSVTKLDELTFGTGFFFASEKVRSQEEIDDAVNRLETALFTHAQEYVAKSPAPQKIKPKLDIRRFTDKPVEQKS